MLMLILTCLLAFYVAWSLGGNDVANSMGTSVGSKAITLRQALVLAGILEFTGAVLFSQRVSATIINQVVDPNIYAATPQLLLAGMTATLIACGLWLQIATFRGWPVASSHAVIGAIAGFGTLSAGIAAINWQTLGLISLTWIVTPLVSGLVAAGLYRLLQHWILRQEKPLVHLQEWIPWLSVLLLTIFGVIVFPTLADTQLVQTLEDWLHLPSQTVLVAIAATAVTGLSVTGWRQLHAPANPAQPSAAIEKTLARFQVVSACFVAFAHGSNDVGNAIAPLAAITYISDTGMIPPPVFQVPLWILILGGTGIVAGLAVLGKRVITTVGENIIPLQPSSGFCAELAAATTVLLASRVGLPVSTSHALVGGVVGIGILQSIQSARSLQDAVQLGTVRQIVLAWLLTLPIVAGLSAAIFWIIRGWF